MTYIKFLEQDDDLAQLINIKCNELYVQLLSMNIDHLDLDSEIKDYFKKCHLERPIFSLKTSALLLYNAIKTVNKPLEEICLLDYGAGVSTLYVLAKKIGIGRVYYSDLIVFFCDLAKQIDALFDVEMDDYIVGDSSDCFSYAKQNAYDINLVVSRNVIEHIYNLQDYLDHIYLNFPKAIVYNSTTANWNNPLVHLQHLLIHSRVWNKIKVEKKEFALTILQTKQTDRRLNQFIEKTRALGGEDFKKAIEEFGRNGRIENYPTNYTNVAGVQASWAENLLPFHKYRQLHPSFSISILPGIWDTNYTFFLVNFLTRIANSLIRALPSGMGNFLSPYIFVIAKPIESNT